MIPTAAASDASVVLFAVAGAGDTELNARLICWSHRACVNDHDVGTRTGSLDNLGGITWLMHDCDVTRTTLWGAVTIGRGGRTQGMTSELGDMPHLRARWHHETEILMLSCTCGRSTHGDQLD